MKAQELEKRYNELMGYIECMDWERRTAENADLGNRIGEAFDACYRQLSDEISEVSGKLEALWKENPDSVSADFREMFEEQERMKEALMEMGWSFDENGILQAD